MTWRPIGDSAADVFEGLAKRTDQKPTTILSQEQFARGIALRAQQPPVSWGWAACQLNCSPYVLRCALEPGYAEHHRENVRRRRLGLIGKSTPQRQVKERESEATYHTAASVPIPERVLADRDRRMAMQPRDLTAALMGDPPAPDWHKRRA
jgi:hypothetical protein